MPPFELQLSRTQSAATPLRTTQQTVFGSIADEEVAVVSPITPRACPAITCRECYSNVLRFLDKWGGLQAIYFSAQMGGAGFYGLFGPEQNLEQSDLSLGLGCAGMVVSGTAFLVIMNKALVKGVSYDGWGSACKQFGIDMGVFLVGIGIAAGIAYLVGDMLNTTDNYQGNCDRQYINYYYCKQELDEKKVDTGFLCGLVVLDIVLLGAYQFHPKSFTQLMKTKCHRQAQARRREAAARQRVDDADVDGV